MLNDGTLIVMGESFYILKFEGADLKVSSELQLESSGVQQISSFGQYIKMYLT